MNGIIFVLIAGCMWGCMGLLVRPLNDLGLHTMDIVALRSVVTAVLTFVGLPTLCKLNGTTAKNDIRIKIKDIWVFIGTGIVSVVFFNFCYFNTILYTSLSVAAIMLYTAPIFVMLISIPVFKNKLDLTKIVALALAFAGCCVVTGAFAGEFVLDAGGIMYGLGAGLGYALYSIFGKIASDKGYSSVTITLYTFLFASIGVLPFINIGSIVNAYVQGGGLVYSLGMVVLTTFLPYIFYTAGLALIEPGKAAVIACIEPVMATFVGWMMYDEILDKTTVIGVVLVVLAIVLINSHEKRNVI